jgi:chaperonin GroES
MKIKPLGDRVVIRPLEEDRTSGGIIIPDTAKEKPQWGEVLAVGAGAVDDKGLRRSPNVKKGDRVLYGRYSGTEMTIDGVECVILSEEEILAAIG